MERTPPGSSVHGISQAGNTGVVCHSLLQGTFPMQGSNLNFLHLLHWQAEVFFVLFVLLFLPLRHLGSLEGWGVTLL